MGLVNTVVPLADLEAEGVRWADEILAMSPTAIRFLKAAFLVATDGLAGLQEFAGNATGLYYTTEEAHEGSKAFLEKRQPDFTQVPAPPLSADPMTRDPAPARPPLAPDVAAGGAAGDAAGRGAPVLRGGRGGLGAGVPLRSDTALACLAVALLLQVAANFANDLSDFRRGADTAERLGPLRVAAGGAAHRASWRRPSRSCRAGRGLVGLYLVSVGGPCCPARRRWRRSSRRSPTPAGPCPTATAAWASSSCSCSSGWWRWSGTAYLQACGSSRCSCWRPSRSARW